MFNHTNEIEPYYGLETIAFLCNSFHFLHKILKPKVESIISNQCLFIRAWICITEKILQRL